MEDLSGEKACCMGMLKVVPEDEREWRLLGGLVEVPEDLREFGRDGRILAVQESNVVLVVILALTFADLGVTACTQYAGLVSNCPMINMSGEGLNKVRIVDVNGGAAASRRRPPRLISAASGAALRSDLERLSQARL